MLESKEARKLTDNSKSAFRKHMEGVEKEIIQQANNGLDWANVTVPSTIGKKVQEELVLYGYIAELKDEGSPSLITVKW